MTTLTVDQNRLRSRHEMYLTNHYVTLHNTLVSVALAISGLAAASLIGLPESYRNYVPILWLMLVTSLLGIAVAYAGTITGSPILPPRVPAMLDLILPLFLGLTEFFLFGILARQVTAINSPQKMTEAWFISSAVFSMAAALSIARARSLIIGGSYDPGISPVVDAYVRRLRGDTISASALALVGTSAAIYQQVNHGIISWFSYVGVGLILAGLCGGFHSQARTRISFHAAISEPDQSESSDKAIYRAEADGGTT